MIKWMNRYDSSIFFSQTYAKQEFETIYISKCGFRFMKKIVTLNESQITRVIEESVKRILSECGGDGASSDCGLMMGSSDPSGGVAYPFGGVMRRGINRIGGGGKKKKGKGKKRKKKKNNFFGSALSRGGSISMNRLS